jgi:hypothetical protein
MESFFDRLHARARSVPALQRLAVISRIMLALAFVPTALVKVTGQRFTTMPVETTIGFFFEAMYRTGSYWRFLGWAQLVSGVLLLVPRTQTLGAVLFFPIALNIFFITVSLEFKGTPVITGLMALANLFLLCWDYDRLKTMFWPASSSRVDRWNGPGPRIERVGYAVGAAGALGAFALDTRIRRVWHA